MCARTTLRRKDLRQVADEIEAMVSDDDAPLYRPRYNVAPSDTTWMVEARGDDRVLVPAVWGYVARDRPLINVRSEQVATGAGFREAFAERRCLVVTDGFYEWSASKRPTWFHRRDDGLVLLAGLFQTVQGRPRFAVLTTRANGLVAAVHDRMPVIVGRDAIDRWLSGELAEATRLLGPADDDYLVATAVSTRVNSVRHDDASCLEPPGPERQATLF